MRRLLKRFGPGLALALLLTIFVLGGAFAASPTGQRVFLVAQAAYRAYKWDRAAERIPNRKLWDIPSEDFTGDRADQVIHGIKTNSRALVQWTIEIVPYFVREGVVGKARYPSMAAYKTGLTDRYHFHIAGQAMCVFHGGYWLNYRYHNPVSPWADRNEFATLVHELGHVQGICGPPTDIMETSNQVVCVEVLASMANDGNAYATKALLEELTDFAMGYLWVQAQEAGVPWLYEWFADLVIYNSFEERARRWRSRAYWEDRDEDLHYVITAYSERPYRWAMAAIDTRSKETVKLRLETWHAIILDDLDYFLKHVRQHVRRARRAAK